MFETGLHKDLYRSIEAIGASIAILQLYPDKIFRFVTANSLFEEISLTTSEQTLEKSINDIFPRYLHQPLIDCFSSSLARQKPTETEIVVDRSGKVRWWRLIASPIFNTQGEYHRLLVTAIEITEKKALEKALESSKRRFEAVINAAYDGIVTVDEQQTIQLANLAAQEMFLIDDMIIGQTKLDSLIPAKYRHDHVSYVAAFKESPVKSRPMHMRASVEGLRSDGTLFPAEVTISKIKVGEQTEMTAIIRDISERATLINELQKAAIQDPLTGIFNRRYMLQIFATELNRANRYGHPLSVAAIDLDHFKDVNDNYGHDAGDKVLVNFSQQVSKSLRDADTFCRWGGEEFLLLMPETDADQGLTAVNRILESIQQMVTLSEERQIQITCSIGLTTSTGKQEHLEKLIQRADTALYEAKHAGRNQIVICPD